jgi:DNA primase
MLETIRRSNMKKIIPELLDIRNCLDELDIAYTEPGSKNTGQNSISIECPWCEDNSFHLGIELNRKYWGCWKCSNKGGIIQLIMKLKKWDYNEAVEHLYKYMNIDPSFVPNNDSELNTSVSEVKLTGVNKLLDPHRNYLESRRFNPDYIFEKYRVNCVGPIGKYNNSIIVPFFKHNRIVTFAAADITRRAENKYTYLSREKSITPIGKTLYNIDNAIDTVIVVEGITDVWRLGDGAVALGRKKFTSWQVKRLVKFKRVGIMLDSDATEMAEELAHNVGMFTEVVLYSLPEGDPADLTENVVNSIKEEFF